MTYTANIPQSSDDPSQSQPLILANFQQLNIQYGTSGDHIPFTASSGNGKHKKVTWLNQSASPPSASVNELVAYGSTSSGITMPYYKRDNLGTVFALSPIKAYASFISVSSTSPQNIAPLDSFNVNNPIVQNYSPTLFFQVTLTQPCRTSNYGVVAFVDQNSFGPSAPRIGYTIISNSVFYITFPGISAPITPFRVTVMVLEF